MGWLAGPRVSRLGLLRRSEYVTFSSGTMVFNRRPVSLDAMFFAQRLRLQAMYSFGLPCTNGPRHGACGPLECLALVPAVREHDIMDGGQDDILGTSCALTWAVTKILHRMASCSRIRVQRAVRHVPALKPGRQTGHLAVPPPHPRNDLVHRIPTVCYTRCLGCRLLCVALR